MPVSGMLACLLLVVGLVGGQEGGLEGGKEERLLGDLDLGSLVEQGVLGLQGLASLTSLVSRGLGLAQTFPHAGGLRGLDTLVRSQERVDTAYSFPCTNTRGDAYFPRPLEARSVHSAGFHAPHLVIAHWISKDVHRKSSHS